MSANRDRVIVRFTFEKVKKWITEYDGSPGKLKPYLLEKVQSYLDRADELLADMVDELF